MKSLGNCTKTEGLQQLDPKDPTVKFLVTKKYIMFEFDRGDFYENYYVRPYGSDKYAIYAHIPELRILANLKDDKIGMLKFLGRSEEISTIIKNSISPEKNQNSPIYVNIEDFTEEECSEKVWCFRYIVQRPLDESILVDRSDSNIALEFALNDMVRMINVFFNVYNEHQKDITSYSWVTKNIIRKLKETIDVCKDHSWFPRFIQPLSGINPEEVREFLKNEKFLLSTDLRSYYFKEDLLEEDTKRDAILFVMPEIFAPSLAGLDIVFVMYLKLENSRWIPRLDLGEYFEFISILLNRVNTKSGRKMTKAAYDLMPTGSKIWFYANTHNDGISLYRYIRDNDDTRYYNEFDDKIYDVNEPYLIDSFWGAPTPETIWEDESLITIAEFFNLGLLLIREAYAYAPIYKKETGAIVLKNFLRGVSIGLNPIGYVLRKVMKKSE